MIIGVCRVYLTAGWVYSLKEKRMVVKSLIEKSRNKFNISIAEIDYQDVHRTVAIGFTCVTNSSNHANSIIDNVVNFIEKNTDAVIDDVVIEII